MPLGRGGQVRGLFGWLLGDKSRAKIERERAEQFPDLLLIVCLSAVDYRLTVFVKVILAGARGVRAVDMDQGPVLAAGFQVSEMEVPPRVAKLEMILQLPLSGEHLRVGVHVLDDGCFPVAAGPEERDQAGTVLRQVEENLLFAGPFSDTDCPAEGQRVYPDVSAVAGQAQAAGVGFELFGF